MFFVRAAFWIFLILLLMPANDKEKSDFYVAAGRTISDLSGFCARNPDVCDKTGVIFETLVQKISTATQLIKDMIRDSGKESKPTYTPREPVSEPRRQQGAQGNVRLAPASNTPQDTLRPDDLQPAWRGPGSA